MMDIGVRLIHSMNKNIKNNWCKTIDNVKYNLITSPELMAIVKDFVDNEKQAIEKLKCCGNCKYEDISYGDNECKYRVECTRVWPDGKNDYWQPKETL